MTVEPVRATPIGLGQTASGWRSAFGSPAGWVRDIGISAALSVWMGLLGPFGAYRAGPVEARVACYLSMSLIAVTLYGLGARLAIEWGRRLGVSPLISVALAVLVVSAPASRIAALIVPVFFPGAGRNSSPLEWYFQAVVLNLPIALAYVTVGMLLARWDAGRDHRASPSLSPPADLSLSPQTRLMARLSPPLAGDLLAISAEDHYVRVHTQAGSQLLLMRFADALADVETLPGVRAHRSWWVARSAIAGAVSKGRHMQLKLANGLDVPVARASAPSIKRMMDAWAFEPRT